MLLGDMSIPINGQTQVPPGFRFHPTEEELLQYYLKKKLAQEIIDMDVIRDVDLNKLEPWDIEETCCIGSAPQNDWYFFCHKDKKYPTRTRTNRATAAGFWKATGRDKVIYSNSTSIGMRKTLVFYKGRAPHGQKSNWIVHEYRLDENTTDTHTDVHNNNMGEPSQEGSVICRMFKKKIHHNKFIASSRSLPGSTSVDTEVQINDQGTLEQIFLEYVSRPNKPEIETPNQARSILAPENCVDSTDRFSRLPCLEMLQNDVSYSCPVINHGENGASLFPIDENSLWNFQATQDCYEASDIWSFMGQSLSPNVELGDLTNVNNYVQVQVQPP